jgi:hypothetical protein
MKWLVSALVVLSVMAGAVAPASAFEAKAFFDQRDHQTH